MSVSLPPPNLFSLSVERFVRFFCLNKAGREGIGHIRDGFHGRQSLDSGLKPHFESRKETIFISFCDFACKMMYQVVNMENLRSGELYVFSDNEFFNPPSYAVVSGWACDGISLSVLMTESPLPEPSMRIDWDCRLPHGLSYSRLPTDAERDRFFRMLKVCDSQQKLVEHCFADHGDRCEIRFKRVFLRPATLGESGDC